MQEPIILENMYVPPRMATSGTRELHVDRPDCGHTYTFTAYMQYSRIDKQESERIRAEMDATPCLECAKEE